MLGLVLEGGGAKGAYHVGVYKAMLEEGIQIDGVTGTSVGALNGAMIVQGDFEEACKLWNNINYQRIMDISNEDIENFKNFRNLSIEEILELGETLKEILEHGGLDITPLKNLIDSYIDESKIRDSEKDFGLVTINMTDKKPIEIFKEDIPEGKLKEYLLATSYLPAFRSERLSGKRYLDGAFYDNLPFTMLLDRGYRRLIIVRTHATGLTKKLDKSRVDAIIIEPSRNIGDTTSYEKEIAKENMKLGYYDAIRKFRNLKGSIFTIESGYDENYYFNIFNDLSEKKIKSLKDIYNISGKSNKRLIFEKILPQIAIGLELKKDWTYEDVAIGLMEVKAEELGINPYAIYSIDYFYYLVESAVPKTNKETVFQKLIDKVELGPVFNKKGTISRVANVVFSKEEILLLE